MSTYSVNIEGVRLNYEKSGSGAPIILLHASPMSSASLSPLIQKLDTSYTVFAIDTPGYGSSERSKIIPDSITYYSNTLHQFCSSLEINNAAIYGTATGAQIAIRYGLDYPNNVSHLFLDNTAHFTTSERDEIMEAYFPDFSVKEDGSHLPKIWHTVDNLFKYFPWCFQDEDHKLSLPEMPLPIIDNVVRDYLISGDGYDWAYRAAFMHEDRQHIYKLQVPTTIFRWAGSILRKYTDRIFDREMAININGVSIPIENDRYEEMSNRIKNNYSGDDYNSEINHVQYLSENRWKDISLGKFPERKRDGSHWTIAWDKLEHIVDNHLISDVHSRNDLLIYWSATA